MTLEIIEVKICLPTSIEFDWHPRLKHILPRLYLNMFAKVKIWSKQNIVISLEEINIMDIWKTLERHLSDIYMQNITLYLKLADKIQYFAAKRRQNSIIATDVKKYCFFLYNTTVSCDCFFTYTDIALIQQVLIQILFVTKLFIANTRTLEGGKIYELQCASSFALS